MRKKRFIKNHSKFVLVTGSSRGIGYAFVKAFLKRGYSIIACSRKTDNVADLGKSYPDQKIIIMNYDLSVPENCAQLFEAAKAYHPCIVVNNAGMMVYGRFGSNEKFDQEFKLDTYAIYLLNKLFYNWMFQQNGGKIINVASTISYINTPYFAGYQAAKSYVLNLSRDLNLEARIYKNPIKVFAVCPGLTDTHLVDESPLSYSKFAMSPDRCVRIALHKIFWPGRKRSSVITGIANILLSKILIHLIPNWLKILMLRRLYGQLREK